MSTKIIRKLNREQRDTNRKELSILKQENKQLKRKTILQEISPQLALGLAGGAAGLGLGALASWYRYREETLARDMSMLQAKIQNCYLKNKDNPEKCEEIEKKLEELEKKYARFRKFLLAKGIASTAGAGIAGWLVGAGSIPRPRAISRPRF